MTPVAKTVLSLGILCLALVFGISFVSTTRVQRHYHRLMYAAHNNMPEQVVNEYHHLPRKLRLIVQSHYDEACKVIDDSASHSGTGLINVFMRLQLQFHRNDIYDITKSESFCIKN